MRTALAITCLFLLAPGISQAQTFGLGGATEYRPVRSQVFGLGTVKPRLHVQPATVQEIRTVEPVATNKESLVVQPATVREIRSVQPQVVCIDGKCYPATQPRQVFQRQPLFRRWR